MVFLQHTVHSLSKGAHGWFSLYVSVSLQHTVHSLVPKGIYSWD
jgi:hypothetical protein